MNRRDFLRTISSLAPAALPAPTGQAGPALSPSPDKEPGGEPRVFFYDDGRHASGLYQFAPPLTPADFTFTVDQLVEAGVDTLFYSAGTEGGVVQYDSQVAPKWGDNVDQWQHEVFYRAARILRQLIADGHDPMKLLCDRCHEKAIRFLPTVCVCIVGGDREKVGGYGRSSDFAYNSRHFYVGEDPDPRAQKLGRFFRPYRLSFLYPEVRQERFRICEELLSRYETDGIELDLSIDNEFGPFCQFSEVGRLAPVLTQWIRDLRAVSRKAEQAQGRRKLLYARVPGGSDATWKTLGFEISRWVSEGLVDGFVCLSTNRPMLDQDIDLSPLVELTRGSRCRVLAGFEGTLGRYVESSATPAMIWAAALNAYDRGADGFGLCEGMWAPNGWPWTAEDYQTLRWLGHPDLLATADKIYRARSLSKGINAPEGLFPEVAALLPQEIAEGASLEVPLRIGDDLMRWQGLERVAAVKLRVRLANFEPALNEVQIQFNGRTLPDSILRRIDLHFRVLRGGIAGPYGYLYEYLLSPDLYPRKKDNTVKVTLLRRDRQQKLPFQLYDVDCSIQYRLHRHFERNPIDY